MPERFVCTFMQKGAISFPFPFTNKDQPSLTKQRDALNHGERAGGTLSVINLRPS